MLGVKKPQYNSGKKKFKTETNKENNIAQSNDVVGVYVRNNKIIIKDNGDLSLNLSIKPCKGIHLVINGEECEDIKSYKVTSADSVAFYPDTAEESRKVNISISQSKMRAYMKVDYNKAYVYTLIDQKLNKNIALRAFREERPIENYYTKEELVNKLCEEGIIYGINNEKIQEAAKGESERKVEVAEGIEVIEDEPSRINFLFSGKTKKDIGENERIDYREININENVDKGEVICEIIPRKEGKNGINVLGEEIIRKPVRDVPIRLSQNCHIEDNKVIADASGRPVNKNGIIGVANSVTIQDVDLKSGNINFAGDVIVGKDIKEGMKVKASGILCVNGNVFSASIISNGGGSIKGNVVSSSVICGEVDLIKKEYIEKLNILKGKTNELIDLTERLTAIKQDTDFNECFQIVLDNRVSDLPKICLNIISFNISREVKNSPLVDFLKNKVLGTNISNLKSMEDLRYLLKLINSEIDYWDTDIMMPVDIRLKYSQGSKIKSTGSVIYTGEGEYTSDITAVNNIIFANDKAVARGGVIHANGNIKLGLVGSLGSVNTIIRGSEKSIITAKIVYANTKIIIGKRTIIIEEPCKSLKVYYDENKQLRLIKLPL